LIAAIWNGESLAIGIAAQVTMPCPPAPHLPAPPVSHVMDPRLRVLRTWPRLSVSPMPAHHP